MFNRNKHICIVHFRSIDYYPPIYNLLKLLDKTSTPIKLTVVTSKFTLKDDFKNINFKQIDTSSSNKIYRYLQYAIFYLQCFRYLIAIRPTSILYFESLSALPCLIYKNIFKRVKLLVHYHEYMTPMEYKDGMILDRINNKLEKLNRNQFSWFSHTNQDRLNLFSLDFGGLPEKKLKVVPNYPLAAWSKQIENCDSLNFEKIELVYIGAISFEDTYIKEVLDFVKLTEDKYNLELFSFSISNDVLYYIQSLNCNSIKYSGPIKYDNIPSVLINKDVGLIVYKCTNMNQVYSEPNKLFEYLLCNLEVWYPYQMKGCNSLRLKYPTSVISVDYMNLNTSINSNCSVYSKDLNFEKEYYTAEFATSELLRFLLN